MFFSTPPFEKNFFFNNRYCRREERRRIHAAEMGRWSESPSDVEKGRHTSQQPPPPPHFSAPTPKPWFSWIVPVIFVANIFMFVYSMYINNCPTKTGKDHCMLPDALKRFSFQPFHENPLLGPSTDTYVPYNFSFSFLINFDYSFLQVKYIYNCKQENIYIN